MKFELTKNDCKKYERKARNMSSELGNDVGGLRELRMELQAKYEIPELMAYNILRGTNVSDYLDFLERQKNGKMTILTEEEKEYQEWLDMKVEREKYDDWIIED